MGRVGRQGAFLGLIPPPARRGDSAMCCGLGVESLACTKNACDTVVAAFFEVNHNRHRDAFHPQARSHRTITAPSGWLRWRFAAFGGAVICTVNHEYPLNSMTCAYFWKMIRGAPTGYRLKLQRIRASFSWSFAPADKNVIQIKHMQNRRLPQAQVEPRYVADLTDITR